MDWFLHDKDLRHGRVNIRSEIWKRSLKIPVVVFVVSEHSRQHIVFDFLKYVIACSVLNTMSRSIH